MSAVQQSKQASIIQYQGEIEEYEENVGAFRCGEYPETEFQQYRLRLGVYGQRQAGAQMFRVKIPGGLAHADHLDALAEIAERYAPLRKGHITTRENVQLHHLTLENASEAMRVLDRVGLSTKEAGGNTVRNVVACPMVGLDPQQAFDIQPYLGGYARRFVRRYFTHNMPRKIKTAFSCGEHDCATVAMHDIGFVARVREQNGEPRKGFKIVVGGGTSIQPLLAQTLYEFVPVEDFLRVSEAVLRVFNETSWLRRNKMRARIKVLIHSEGIDAFRQRVEEELQKEWAQGYGGGEELLFLDPELDDAPALSADAGDRGKEDADFQAWRETNVFTQPQRGYVCVAVTVPQGDLNPEQFRGLAGIARRYASHRARTTPEQNLMFRWVPEAYLYDVYEALEGIGLSEGGLNRVTDVTACPGTDSCKLGITSSMGLNRAVAALLKNPNGHAGLLEDPLVHEVHVKVSGCPNGCGRHHVADIGFHGAVMKGPDGKQIPAYELFLGGSYENGDVRYGIRPRGKVPAKWVPGLVLDVLRHYKENRRKGERFRDYVSRVGEKPFERIIAGLGEVPAAGRETIGLYMDYERPGLYKVERGEGECAV